MDINKGKIVIKKGEKNIHETNDEKFQIIHFKENIPDKGKNNVFKIKGKGKDNCAIAVGIYKYLKSFNIPTHFKEQIQTNEILIKMVDRIPVKICIWNIASGEFGKNYKIKKGEFLKCPVIEYYLNMEKFRFPMINTDHILAFECATEEECKAMDIYSRKINAILRSYFERRGYKLGKFELEFGRLKNSVILASDITPDNCQFWNMEEQGNKWFYLNQDDVSQAYKKLTESLLK